MRENDPTTRSDAPDAYLITDAQESLDEQHRVRVRKYLTLMAFRVPALIIAAIAYSATGSGLLALAIVAASIPLPWVAVLIANDRPPRKRGEVPQYKYGADHDVVGPPQLGAAWDTRAADAGESGRSAPPSSRTIDSHLIDDDR